MRFYKYTADDTLNEYAKRFFSLSNAMYRIRAQEGLDTITYISAGLGGDGSKDVVGNLLKQTKGLHGIVQEVRTIKDN